MIDLGPIISGGGIVLIREVWVWVRSRRSPEELAAKDRLIAVHEAEIARLKREVWAAKKDADDERRRRQEQVDRTVGVAARMRLDSQIDETEFEADLPTEVRERVERVVPKGSMRPAGIPDKKQLPDRAGRVDYDGLRLDEITPTALAPPMGTKRRGQ